MDGETRYAGGMNLLSDAKGGPKMLSANWTAQENPPLLRGIGG